MFVPGDVFTLILFAGQWQHWSKRVVEYCYPKTSVPDYASILVPNVDNVRTKFLIDVIAKQNKVIVEIQHKKFFSESFSLVL